MVPAFVTESEIVSFLADLCHEWATEKHPEVHRIDRKINLKIRYEKPQDISAIRKVNEAVFETGTESDRFPGKLEKCKNALRGGVAGRQQQSR